MAQRPISTERAITDDLNAMLEVLPPTIRQWLEEQPDLEELLEVVLDLGADARSPIHAPHHPPGEHPSRGVRPQICGGSDWRVRQG
jgi:hypothetical protein